MKPIPFNEPLFTTGELIAAAEVDAVWMRTMLQRDKVGLLGTKHRTGRLLFSLADIAAVTILHGLNAGLRVAPSAAWQVVAAAVEVVKKASRPMDEVMRVAFDADGLPFIWTVDSKGVISAWNDHTDANLPAVIEANQRVHVAIPMIAVMRPIGAATKIAMDWPDQEAQEA